MTSIISSFSLLECFKAHCEDFLGLSYPRSNYKINYKIPDCDLDFAWARGFQNIITKICTMPQKLES